MEKITFVIPSRNNLEFLQLAYKSIRDLKMKHEILVLNDASNDGTQEWIENLGDEDLIVYHNPGPERIGIVGMFDKGIEMARTEIIFAFHSDMVAAPNLDENILKHLEKGKVVSATRVEPPLHPPGPEKIIKDFGIEVEDFVHEKWNKESIELMNERTTEGIFAPWCMYKEDFLAIGGHDELFAPQSKEDSDLFNRMQLAGYKFIQPWDALVYHFTSRGSRFNKHAGGAAGKNSQEWLNTTNVNARNFIRKWGHFIKHDKYMKPIIPNKYEIAISIKNCNDMLLQVLEPWCSSLHSDGEFMKYWSKEQPSTKYPIKEKLKRLEDEVKEGIHIKINGLLFNQQDFQYINQISEIINDSGKEGVFKLGHLDVEIKEIKKCNIS